MGLLQKFTAPSSLKSFVRLASSFNKTSECVYKYAADAEKFPKATQEMRDDFHTNGFVLVKNLLTSAEVNALTPVLITGEKAFYDKLGFFRQDQKWGLVLWNEQGKDFLGMLGGNAKLAGLSEQLLNRGEMYLYHGKLLRKEAKQGGSAAWHQDYAQWYGHELLFPDLVSCTIALTDSNRVNGGTSVLKTSQRCGRIDHAVNLTQQGADEERMELIKRALPQFDLDMSPGDGVFFHCNLLRASGPNPSDHLRCHLKFVYNTKLNSPSIKHDFSDAVYNKIEAYPADALLNNKNWDVETRKWKQTEEDIQSGLDHETVWDL